MCGFASAMHGTDALLPAEQALGQGVAPRRLEDLRRGRTAARQALRALGQPAAAILRETNGGPRFPAGLVGSISHAGTLAIAAAAPARCLDSIGIDLERPGAASEGDLTALVPALEVAALRHRFSLSPVAAAVAGFSLRESVFKAVSARLRRWVDFDECGFAVTACGKVAVHARSSDLKMALAGAACLLYGDEDWVLTAVCLPAATASSSG
jgi:4'-phosphopantetheinyl transferase EntD